MNLFGALMDILTVVSRVLIEVIVTTVVAIGLLGCFVYTLLGKLLGKLLRKAGL
jgi:hypothetical protein